MNMLIPGVIAFLLLLVGPILGYKTGIRRGLSKRWQVLVCSTAGGFVAGIIVGVMIRVGSSHVTAEDVVPYFAGYVLFGFVLGLAVVLSRAANAGHAWADWLMVIGVSGVLLLAVKAALYWVGDKGASGVVLGSGDLPIAGAPVFVDRGSGAIERLTTDATGSFRAALEPNAYKQATFLICAPGMMPMFGEADEKSLTAPRYYVHARMPPVYLFYVADKWRRAPIPRECLDESDRQQ